VNCCEYLNKNILFVEQSQNNSMKHTLILSLLFLTITLNIKAQPKICATMDHWEKLNVNDPNALVRKQLSEFNTQQWINAAQKRSRPVITIPVVVHVVYHATVENVSNSQIFSQIESMNNDFRSHNSDTMQSTHPFWPHLSDTQIEFCLASQDENGNVTTGITRTYTDIISFNGNGSEKYDSLGGKSNWDPTSYLNIWVCNLGSSGGTIGYATFPSELSSYPEDDGVVIDYRAFGTIGAAGTDGFESKDLGRTAVHEIGHWLNLNHIWGDAVCGDDLVADTPPHELINTGCPTFPWKPFSSCNGSDANGEMYMNYMDYVDDSCMIMFTSGQSSRMDAALFNERSAILNSTGCSVPVGITKIDKNLLDVEIYPNPSMGHLFLDILNPSAYDFNITIHDILGKLVYQNKNKSEAKNLIIDLSDESKGIYILTIYSDYNSFTEKVVIRN
jgi:hypothetical protein